MKMFNKLVVSGLVLAMGSFSSVANAEVSGSTKFSVELPNILVLYHWDSANLKFENFEDVHNDGTVVSETLALGDVTLNSGGTKDVADTPIPQGFDTSNLINVKLKNSWAVRSLSGANGVNLTVATPNGKSLTANDGSGSTVGIDSVTLSQASASADASSLDLASGWTAKRGDINFTLNLSTATASGKHSTSGSDGETFELTLKANP